MYFYIRLPEVHNRDTVSPLHLTDGETWPLKVQDRSNVFFRVDPYFKDLLDNPTGHVYINGGQHSQQHISVCETC